MKTIRIILAAHGEAETAGLMENFRVGWRTLGHAAGVMGLSLPLRLTVCSIAALRKRVTGRGGSSHNANTRDQAIALQDRLNEYRDGHYVVQSAFASAPPYLEEQISATVDIQQQMVVNLIPSDSRLSCGLVCHALIQSSQTYPQPPTVSSRLWEAPELVDIHLAHIAARFPHSHRKPSNCLLLVLHGTLIKDRNGQAPPFHTGQEEKDFYANALLAKLMSYPDRPWQRVEIAYINHGVGGQWSRPSLSDMLSRLEQESVSHLTAYACEHLVDGSETSQLVIQLDQSSIPETHCLPCLNSSPDLIDFLAERIRAASNHHQTALCCDHCPLRVDTPVDER